MNLAEYRAALRLDLNDPAGAAQRFSDGDLNRAMARTVQELSLVWPKVSDTEVVVAVSGRKVELASGGFPGLMEVEEVEWPYGLNGSEARYPAALRVYELAPDRGSVGLLMEEVLPAGARVRVRWCSAHSVTEGSTTVPAELDGLVVRGAYGLACLAYSTPASDNFRYEDGATVAAVDDTMIPKEWRARGEAALEEMREGLEGLKRRRGIGMSVAWGSPSWMRGGEWGAAG